MKNHDDPRLLAHKRSVDHERRAQATLRTRLRQQHNAERMERVANAPHPSEDAQFAAAIDVLRKAGVVTA